VSDTQIHRHRMTAKATKHRMCDTQHTIMYDTDCTTTDNNKYN